MCRLYNNLCGDSWGLSTPPLYDVLYKVFVKTTVPRSIEREFFIDNLLVRIHFIIVMIRWTGLAPWEFEFPFPGSLTSTFLIHTLQSTSSALRERCTWAVCREREEEGERESERERGREGEREEQERGRERGRERAAGERERERARERERGERERERARTRECV